MEIQYLNIIVTDSRCGLKIRIFEILFKVQLLFSKFGKTPVICFPDLLIILKLWVNHSTQLENYLSNYRYENG